MMGSSMTRLVDQVLRRFLTKGRLVVRYPDGRTSTFQGSDGPAAGVHLRTPAAVRGLLLNPGLAFGESYMDGSLVPLDCTLYDLLDVLMHNEETGGGHLAEQIRGHVRTWFRRLAQFNPARRSRQNVAHHYDLDDRLYRLFLDPDRQYSCAYFARGDETLEAAQLAKKHHIASKLLLDRPGLRVLDIGCGWGGMAMTLASEYGADVTGITLSEEQLAAARARVQAAGLSDRVRFELLDYRDPQLLRYGAFDRVVSVGMFEHVGINHFRTFFNRLKELLDDDGVALIHAIGRSEGPGSTNPWITKYIFPGGYSPALSEVLPAAERSGLVVTDIEILRLHYARTLRHWRQRFAEKRPLISQLYDERFCRMFEFYLAGSELAFRRQGHMNWQMQLARHKCAVPLTRDYMIDAERATVPANGWADHTQHDTDMLVDRSA